LSALKSRIIATGLLLGAVIAAAVMASPLYLHLLNPGPMIPGHEALSCVSCRSEAPGTARQQIQANVAYWLGLRQTRAAFGFKAPASPDCTGCHERPDDPHSLHRFAEPRFAEALKTVAADSCLGCHQEHQGARVSSDTTFCSACHSDLALKGDPLDVPHRTLVAQAKWSGCLGCHDYHGNHDRKTQQRLADAYDVMTIRSYLSAGPDPYAAMKRRKARENRE
jgi:hypothetical protein